MALLELRKVSESLDIDLLEKEFNLKFPPIFRLFAQTYYLGEDGIIRQQYLNEETNDYFDCKSYNYFFNGENIGFSYFTDLMSSLQVYSSGDLGDMIYKNHFFPFGSSDGNGLFVGISGLGMDKIFWDKANAQEPIQIAVNAFEFLRGVFIEDVEEEFLVGTKRSMLYRNFGEEFWRIKK